MSANTCTDCFTQRMRLELLQFAVYTRLNTIGWGIAIVSLLYAFFVLRSTSTTKQDTVRLSKPHLYLLSLALAALAALVLVYVGLSIWERVYAFDHPFRYRYSPQQFQEWWWKAPDRRPNDWVTYISSTTSTIMAVLIGYLAAKINFDWRMTVPSGVTFVILLAVDLKAPRLFPFTRVIQLVLAVFLITVTSFPSAQSDQPRKRLQALMLFAFMFSAQFIILCLSERLTYMSELQALNFNLSIAAQALAVVYLARFGVNSHVGEIVLDEEA